MVQQNFSCNSLLDLYQLQVSPKTILVRSHAQELTVINVLDICFRDIWWLLKEPFVD